MDIIVNKAEYETSRNAFVSVGERLQYEIDQLVATLMGGCGVEGKTRDELVKLGSSIKAKLGNVGSHLKACGKIMAGFSQAISDADDGHDVVTYVNTDDDSIKHGSDVLGDSIKQIGIDYETTDSAKMKIAEIAERCREMSKDLSGHIQRSQGNMAEQTLQTVDTAQTVCESIALLCNRVISDLESISTGYQEHEGLLSAVFEQKN